MCLHNFGLKLLAGRNLLVLPVDDFSNFGDCPAFEEGLQVEGKDRLYLEPIEANDQISSTAQFPSPDLLVMRDSPLLVDKVSLLAQRILIDCNSLFVSEYFESGLRDSFEVAADQEGRLESTPKGKMSLVFVVGHQPIAYLEHVWVVPSSRA